LERVPVTANYGRNAAPRLGRLPAPSSFHSKYAMYYDIIYADKNYEEECAFLTRIFKRFSDRMPKTILDAGCGTGGHALRLAAMGHLVTGVDASKYMISVARAKSSTTSGLVDFVVGDVRNFSLPQEFDACISMFSVINYLISNEDLEMAFRNIRRHLKGDSLFVFDFWYSPAVLAIRPERRKKEIWDGRLHIVRWARPRLNPKRSICEVRFDLRVTDEAKLVYSGSERHVVRYYGSDEIERLLNLAGFKVVTTCKFLDLKEPPSESTWDASVIARAR